MIFVALAGLWFGVTGCYVLVIHAKALKEADRLNAFWTFNLLPWAIVGISLDCIFNITAGTIIFRELPRELLFSHRVQRHVDKGGSRVAEFWKRQLNQIDPTHIK